MAPYLPQIHPGRAKPRHHTLLECVRHTIIVRDSSRRLYYLFELGLVRHRFFRRSILAPGYLFVASLCPGSINFASFGESPQQRSRLARLVPDCETGEILTSAVVSSSLALRHLLFMSKLLVDLYKAGDDTYAIRLADNRTTGWLAEKGFGGDFTKVWTVEFTGPEMANGDSNAWDALLERAVEAYNLSDPIVTNVSLPKVAHEPE